MPLRANMNDLADAMDAVKHEPTTFTCPSAPGTTYEVVGIIVREFDLPGRPTGHMAVRVDGEWS